MANPRVLHQLRKINSALSSLTAHVRDYSGVNPREAAAIEKEAEGIAENAAVLIQEAHAAGAARRSLSKLRAGRDRSERYRR